MMAQTERVWTCKIGTREAVDIRPGADLPMRRAVEAAFEKVAGVEAEFNFSGWGGSLDENELAVVENRPVSREHYLDWCLREAAPELLSLVEDIEESLTADGTYRLLREACRAAIAKATGASS